MKKFFYLILVLSIPISKTIAETYSNSFEGIFRDFKNSEPVIEKILADDPGSETLLKEDLWEIFQELGEEGFLKSKQSLQAQMIRSEALFYFRYASDRALAEFSNVYAKGFKFLTENRPGDCFDLINSASSGSSDKLFSVLPDKLTKEMANAFRGIILDSNLEIEPVLISNAEYQATSEKILANVFKKLPENDIAMEVFEGILEAIPENKHLAVCKTITTYYEEINNLPWAERVNHLRRMYNFQ